MLGEAAQEALASACALALGYIVHKARVEKNMAYRANWKPHVTNTEDRTRVWVVKKAVPWRDINKVPAEAKQFIGEVSTRSDNHDDRLNELVDQAWRRASVLEGYQNALNYR